MFQRLSVLCALILWPLALLAQDQPPGLHNDTKVFTDPDQMTEADWTNEAETLRTWQAALIRVPLEGGGSAPATLSELADRFSADGKRHATVIYLHGCSGIWAGTHQRMKFLADNGYLVIAPASFARQKYPKSCDPVTHEGGLYRHTLKMRQADAGYAIQQARALPFVAPDQIALMGLSQGAITTATFDGRDPTQRVAARVVEGWTCTAGWSEYGGIAAPRSEPVLTLVARDDPWFQSSWTKGDCGYAIDRTNGSASIVYTEPDLVDQHELLGHVGPQNDVLTFLATHMGTP